MIWSVVAHIFSTLLDLVRISRMSDHGEDLENLVLRFQSGIAGRRLTIKPDRNEKLTLAVLTASLKRQTSRTMNQPVEKGFKMEQF